MADSITIMNTMNPVDLYHDPSLDDLYTSGGRYPHIAAGADRRRQRREWPPDQQRQEWPPDQQRREWPPHQQRRDWAPDRSPLQKLEVTLNDISKEEKRARVQEAEMRLRESKAKRAVSAPISSQPPASARPQQRPMPLANPSAAVDKAPVQDGGLVRNLSTTQRNRLQHSTVIDSHRPDRRRLSAEANRGFEYSGSGPHDRPAGSPSEAPRLAESRQSARFADPARDARAQQSQWRRNEPDDLGQPSFSTARAAPPQDHQPNPPSREDMGENPAGLAERQRNASHKAALANLTDLDQPRPRPRHMSPSTIDSQPKQHDSGDLVGLGLTPTSRPTATNALSARAGSDQPQQKQRRPSVTFKEPAVRASVDEWKHAATARLSLADFALDRKLDSSSQNQAWWELNSDPNSRRRAKARASFGLVGDAVDDSTAEFNPPLYLRCGPLLRYTGMKRTSKPVSGNTNTVQAEIWRGSVMIVTQDSRSSYHEPPILRLFSRPKSLLPPPPARVRADELAPEYIDPIAGLEKISRTGRALYVRPIDHLETGKDLSQVETDDGLFESSPSLLDANGNQTITTAATHNRRTSSHDGEHLGRYQEVPGARLYADPDRDVTFWRFNVEVELADSQQHIAYRINRGASSSFWVPARGETMNMMFYSCNGFSTSVNPDLFSGPDPLWRDVLNVHQTRPFHVMIGGGDQIYNDCVKSETLHFASWIQLRNPHQKHAAPFTPEMQEELETFYLNRYALCFSQGLFGMATSQIPMVNMWDDHDIIDGFGSYPDHFMKSPVFSGLGNVAFKYYMLFQHQAVPEETPAIEPSWVLGHEPGPYIHQLSRSLFMHMGSHVAFLGIDCRTERMRDEILSVRSFDILLEKCRKEIIEGDTKHLIVLLGVPIAYPRLVWLENVLTSRAMDPVKALGRVGIIKTSFLNNFDGGVEILDDLDDHWTASHHKSERNDLITDLQDLAAEKSVRITILGGDVHLAAVGQFYSNPKLKIPKDKDHRYMPNVISSAIVNTPPPAMLADVINKRNKTHHLNAYTDENMIPMFTHDVDHKKRNNTHLLPRRNWCSIREYTPGATPPPSLSGTPSVVTDDDLEFQDRDQVRKRSFSLTRQAVNPAALLRKLSTRKAPPSSYPDMMAAQQLKSASYDGSQPTRANFFAFGTSDSRARPPSLDSDEPQRRAASFDHATSHPPSRPGILRRPTNLSAKAARKGNVPAIDADGNEIDVNDHINLEGGLDIVINAEVDQKDPAGITIPYRLLVPALWYDGSSDRQKLESAAAGVVRKSSLLKRFRVGGQRSQKLAQNQGAGNWGQEMSDTESASEGDDGLLKQPPKSRFSLFAAFAPPPPPPAIHAPAQRLLAAGYRQPAHQTSKAVQRAYDTGQLQPPATQAPIQNDVLYDTTQRPPSQHLAHPVRQTSKAVQRAYDTGQLQSPTTQAPTQNDVLYDTTNRPPSQHLAQSARTTASGRRSLTITSFKDHDRMAASNRSASDTYPIQHPTPTPQSQATAAIPQRTLSKQERVLGLGAADTYASEHVPRGYTGIDAYREPNKLKRGFSLKKARDWLDGKRAARENEPDDWTDEEEASGHTSQRRVSIQIWDAIPFQETAAQSVALDIIKLLFEPGASVENGARLHIAARHQRSDEVIKCFIEKGANINELLPYSRPLSMRQRITKLKE
ncbi:hypothetical protein DV736_g2115, partial [Chaetothyriales sp. CBS 134916]